nr:E112 [uncultured bacterium]ART38454.1 G408 [uncultured bacterium]
MKHGLQILDADLHVIEPYDLYLKYMDPKWGDRIPHADCSFPHVTEKFLALEGIDATSKRKILWDNPARMYNL